MKIFEKSRIITSYYNIAIKILDLLYSKSSSNLIYILRRNILTLNSKIIFVCEKQNWAVYWIGKNLTENIKKLKSVKAEIASPRFAKNKIIHWGAINYLIEIGLSYLKRQNFNIVNWYHIIPNDKRLKLVPYLNKYVDILITASPITKTRLVESGFEEKKITIIPFGIDLSNFKRYSNSKKKILRKKIDISEDKLIIGSFQKDGEGWKDGLKPKMVKGPDIFCDVVKMLSQKYNIHVLLTGPARDFVKNKLEEYKVPYTHLILKDYMKIVDCYNILDLYLITSRVEGGPQALLEAMATGVPLVTTNVGMAPYLIKNEINGFKTEIENIDELYKYASELLKDKKLKETIISNALNTVKEFAWENIVEQYYNKVFKKFL